MFAYMQGADCMCVCKLGGGGCVEGGKEGGERGREGEREGEREEGRERERTGGHKRVCTL